MFKDLVDLRYNKQNELEALKRFPIRSVGKSE